MGSSRANTKMGLPSFEVFEANVSQNMIDHFSQTLASVKTCDNQEQYDKVSKILDKFKEITRTYTVFEIDGFIQNLKKLLKEAEMPEISETQPIELFFGPYIDLINDYARSRRNSNISQRTKNAHLQSILS